MPELPEVESVRRKLARALRGRRIVGAEAADDPVVFEDVAPARFAKALEGRVIEDVRRKGKHLYFTLDRRPWPLFHFGMTGWFDLEHARHNPRVWGRDREAAAPRRFQKLRLTVEGGAAAVFTDPRRFGRIRLQQNPPGEPPLSLLGFDVLDDLPPSADLQALVSRRRAPVKAVLLDQSLFAGVGNWVADEVLFRARLRPDRPASSLSPADTSALRRALRSVIARAVAVGADSERFPAGWLFHHRWGRKTDARTSRGDKIVHTTVGGRTTAWVPSRQK